MRIYIYFKIFDSIKILRLILFFKQMKESMAIWSNWNMKKKRSIFQLGIDSKLDECILGFVVNIFYFLFFLFHHAWLELYYKLWRSPWLKIGDLERNWTMLQKQDFFFFFVTFLLGNSYIKATLKDEKCTLVSEYLHSHPPKQGELKEKSPNN